MIEEPSAPDRTAADDTMPAPIRLTVVIVAKNEATQHRANASPARRLPTKCWCSTRAAPTARPRWPTRAGARVVVTDWPGYGPQVARGFGWRKATGCCRSTPTSALRRRCAPRSCAAIAVGDARRLSNPAPVGVLRASSFTTAGWRPDYTLRLGRRDRSGFTDHFLHAHMTVDGTVGDLKAELIHYSYPDVHDVLEKLDRYSSGHARDMLARGKSASVPQGGRARPVRVRADVCPAARVPRWSARIDACDLQR